LNVELHFGLALFKLQPWSILATESVGPCGCFQLLCVYLLYLQVIYASVRRHFSHDLDHPARRRAGSMVRYFVVRRRVGMERSVGQNVYYSSISLILYRLVVSATSSNRVLRRTLMPLRASPSCGRSRGSIRTSTRTLRRHFFRCIQNLRSYLPPQTRKTKRSPWSASSSPSTHTSMHESSLVRHVCVSVCFPCF